MKNLTKTLVISAGLLIAAPSFADAKSDSALLTACKQDIKQNVEGVSNIKVGHIKTRRGLFSAKFRVTANGESMVMQCSSDNGSDVAVSCVSGAACDLSDVVAN